MLIFCKIIKQITEPIYKLQEAIELNNIKDESIFKYEYDDNVWGHDRAFFGEESLFYPFCDCEDRSILLSHLVRDLVGLDVVLVYYPGHLAMAVDFKEDVDGEYYMYDNRKFVVCDPTYIGASVGQAAMEPNGITLILLDSNYKNL